MPAHLILTSFGLFLIGEKNKVISHHLTYPDVEAAASEFTKLSEGEPTEGLKIIVDNLLALGVDGIVVGDGMLARALTELTKIPVTVDKSSSHIRLLRDSQDSHFLDSGIISTRQEVASFRRAVAIRLSRESIIAASEEKDLLIKHAVDAIGEVDRSINMLSMRLREWYSLHHPSLSDLIDDHEVFSRVVQNCGGRSQVTAECLSEAGVSEDLAQRVMDSMLRDLGAPFAESDLAITKNFAEGIQRLFADRQTLESYVEQMMRTEAPNITALVGSMVGARLISLAGSLRELAQKPSSTVQIFGAEKALFRSLKTGSAPPKHGIIYQVPEVNSAPYWQRGKIARALAGKISIAARIDAYSKRDAGEDLKKKFLERVEEIRKQNIEEPPPKPTKKQRKMTPKRGKGRGHHRKRKESSR
ncbi:MAG: C/D box methylation guide ribonucleoprotein complex aNOP56 subunit [Candidatus Thorarchaeota archaeon]